MNKKQITSIILNCIIFILVFFATFCMLAGIELMNDNPEILAFTSSNLEAFKYFTVDSNVLAGLAALVFIIFQVMLAKGKITSIPKAIYALKLAGTAGVSLTMLVTICFLIPQFGEHWYILFMNNNLFFHLLIPLLCIISFGFFEPMGLYKLSASLFGLIPMALYGIAYTINIAVHLNGPAPLKDYDWYNFLDGKLSNAIISVPVMIIVTWLISLGLWGINYYFSKKVTTIK